MGCRGVVVDSVLASIVRMVNSKRCKVWKGWRPAIRGVPANYSGRQSGNRPRKAFLSKALIAHLNYGGVPNEYFLELLMNALADAKNIHSNKRAALRVALNYGDMDDLLAARMILCGIPLDEPFLYRHLSVLAKEEKKGLKGGKIPISECYNVMGTADPTGILKRDEVCVILDSGQMVGTVLVYRHPGLHLGDIHVLTATYVKQMENIVGNAKYGIFFSTQGSRSVADEMAGGDFDGDMYWVSRNPKLLHYFRPSEPWTSTYAAKGIGLEKPTDFSSEELERKLFQQFLDIRFQPSHAAGIAADSWLSFMDRLLVLGDECVEEKECLKKKMLQLIDIYYDALDAPRTGIKVEIPNELKASKFPHFMERTNGYTSTSILGLIYDKVDLLQTEGLTSTEVWKLPCFDVVVPPTCLVQWDMLYRQYRNDMCNALQNKPKNLSESGQKKQSSNSELADEVIEKYKKEFYHAPEFRSSARNEEEIFNDALAIYHLAYDYAKQKNDAGKCKVVWKIAGQALCKIYLKRQNDEPIFCSKSVLREVLN
ncbi:probable RNA-dependent RNA polymerase 5 [Telopea speciosissima]|uniref:probable RNA-dependent RNA polymerase 5 n=1 Tax=Telopea speciosissima TaxID=54955 RepID=UPI001CC74BB6|nr:probable RNA-dependent RNA polymerase 5 [Telopea speciosissima]